MPNDKPFFSIIVPTYNQAHYLRGALDSLIAQTDPDWEAVVINDGSTDQTPEILDAYANRDRRFLIIHKLNGGTASALNEGLKQAKGDWVCWLSSDDMFEPDKLALHRIWIQTHPETKFYFTYFRFLYEATGKMDRDHDLWGPLPEPRFQVLDLFYRNYVNGISICANRKAWLQVGFFDENAGYAQDYDMWLRLLALFPGVFIPEWTCISRTHELQGMMTFPQRGLYDSAKVAINFLNKHKFEDLFPLMDLNQPESAKDALDRAIEIASRLDAFIYALGTHSALILRIMQWIGDMFSSGDSGLAQELERSFKQCAIENGQKYGDSAFGFLWNAAANQNLSLPLQYQLISHIDVGITQFWLMNEYQHLLPDLYWYKRESLKKYLEECEKIVIGDHLQYSKTAVANLYPLTTIVKVRLADKSLSMSPRLFLARLLRAGRIRLERIWPK